MILVPSPNFGLELTVKFIGLLLDNIFYNFTYELKQRGLVFTQIFAFLVLQIFIILSY